MIKTTFLQLKFDARRHATATPDTNALTTAAIDDAALCAALYKEVGRPWYWDIYRVGWSGADWQDYLQHPDIDISALRHDGQVVGYLELRRHAAAIEIVNLGLRPAHIGRGLGKLALERAIHRGFSFGVPEIWLHTCSLDHPAAMHNYTARGFCLLRESIDNFIPLDPTVRAESALA